MSRRKIKHKSKARKLHGSAARQADAAARNVWLAADKRARQKRGIMKQAYREDGLGQYWYCKLVVPKNLVSEHQQSHSQMVQEVSRSCVGREESIREEKMLHEIQNFLQARVDGGKLLTTFCPAGEIPICRKFVDGRIIVMRGDDPAAVPL